MIYTSLVYLITVESEFTGKWIINKRCYDTISLGFGEFFLVCVSGSCVCTCVCECECMCYAVQMSEVPIKLGSDSEVHVHVLGTMSSFTEQTPSFLTRYIRFRLVK